MPEHDIGPCYCRIDYTSLYAPHVALIPTRQWLPTSITGTMGSFVDWNTNPIDAEDMIDSLIAKWKVIHLASTTFNLATIFEKAAPDAPAVPRAIKSLAVAGTSVATGISKAIQGQLNMRSSLFYPAKLVSLDVPIGAGQLDKLLPISFGPSLTDIVLELGGSDRAWSARDGSQILQATSYTITENNRLRKQYRMG